MENQERAAERKQVSDLVERIAKEIRALKLALGEYEERALEAVDEGAAKVKIEDMWSMNLAENIRSLKLDIDIRAGRVDDDRIAAINQE